jgi:hypothetical protein
MVGIFNNSFSWGLYKASIMIFGLIFFVNILIVKRRRTCVKY